MATPLDPEAAAAQGYTPTYGDRFAFHYQGAGPYKDYLDRVQQARTLQMSRDMNPLSVSQVPEPYQRSLATPDQFTKAPPVMEPSSVPSYQPSALDFSMRQSPTGSPLTPSFGSPAPDLRQGFGRSPLTPPTPQPHFQAEQGPPQQIERDVLDPRAPANTAQRDAFKANMELASKWPPGMATQNRTNTNVDTLTQGLMSMNPGMDYATARGQAQYIVGGGEKADLARDREGRLIENSQTRERQGDDRIAQQKEANRIKNERLKLMEQQFTYAKGRLDKTDTLGREKFEHQRMFDHVKAALYELKSNQEAYDEEGKQILRNIIGNFIGGDEFDITQEFAPGMLDNILPGWAISKGTPKGHFKEKPKPQGTGAPQGAPSTGGETRQYQGKTYRLLPGKDRSKTENWVVEP